MTSPLPWFLALLLAGLMRLSAACAGVRRSGSLGLLAIPQDSPADWYRATRSDATGRRNYRSGAPPGHNAVDHGLTADRPYAPPWPSRALVCCQLAPVVDC
jgi:hypothetical protein